MKTKLEDIKQYLEGWTVLKIDQNSDRDFPGLSFTLKKDNIVRELDLGTGCCGEILINNIKDVTNNTWADLNQMISNIIQYKDEYLNDNDLYCNDEDDNILETINGEFVAKYEIITDEDVKKLQLGFKALPSGKVWRIKLSDIRNSDSKFKKLFSSQNDKQILLEILNKYWYNTSKYPKEWESQHPELFK